MIPEAKLYHHQSPMERLDSARLREQSFTNYHYIFTKHRKKGIVSRILFFYSMTGLVLIDFCEWITHRNVVKWRKFKAGVSSAVRILTRRGSAK